MREPAVFDQPGAEHAAPVEDQAVGDQQATPGHGDQRPGRHHARQCQRRRGDQQDVLVHRRAKPLPTGIRRPARTRPSLQGSAGRPSAIRTCCDSGKGQRIRGGRRYPAGIFNISSRVAMPHPRPCSAFRVQDEDIRQRFEHYRNTRGFTPNSIMTMVRRPQIVRAFMALNQAVLYEGTVPHETKMLVSLASSYAWLPLLPVAHGQPVEHLQGVRREDCRAVELRGKRVIHPGRARRRPAGAESREATERSHAGRLRRAEGALRRRPDRRDRRFDRLVRLPQPMERRWPPNSSRWRWKRPSAPSGRWGGSRASTAEGDDRWPDHRPRLARIEGHDCFP